MKLKDQLLVQIANGTQFDALINGLNGNGEMIQDEEGMSITDIPLPDGQPYEHEISPNLSSIKYGFFSKPTKSNSATKKLASKKSFISKPIQQEEEHSICNSTQIVEAEKEPNQNGSQMEQNASHILDGYLATPKFIKDAVAPKKYPISRQNLDSQTPQHHQYERHSFNYGQRRGWHNGTPKIMPKFHPQRYPYGWLFRDLLQDDWSQNTPGNTENETANEEQPFQQAPIIFMLNLTTICPFFTKKYCFSNHYICERLVIDGVSFCCVEQYYMFYKARVFGDDQAKQQIMATNDPKWMKRIGMQVVGFDQSKWYRIAIQVVVIASVKKYEQNATLRRQLFETSGIELVETNPTDERWGIGLSLSDWRTRDKALWRGNNVLGRLLTKVREKLLERPEFAHERDEILREIQESMAAAKMVGCLQVGRNEEENIELQPQQQALPNSPDPDELDKDYRV